jgi:hypothetical protein
MIYTLSIRNATQHQIDVRTLLIFLTQDVLQ